MYYVLMDSTGNLIESFRDEDAARAALEEIVENEPEAAEDVVLLAYEDDGTPGGDPVFGTHTPASPSRTRPSAPHLIRDELRD